ncbi:hypothetical protein [Aeromicrobium massiliense]|uniref:hypothetical protein n=1 Tax=Aeromicrobium massiliense TaxID=1464554 RepID=UPI0002EDAAF1|nr:hypothetical protein [Aeromicrobium massiliense]
MRIRSIVSTIVAAGFLVTAAPTAAQASDYFWMKDRVGDARATSDITRVKVTKTDSLVITKISLRKVKRSSPVELYYDTKGDGRPDYRVRIKGSEQIVSEHGWKGGSTYQWGGCLNELGGQRAVSYQTKAKTITVKTPLECMAETGTPTKIRVAASAKSGSTRDWAYAKRHYTRWLR